MTAPNGDAAICTECGKECTPVLRRVAVELPDWPYLEYETSWVSDCCEADYDY